MHFFFHTRGHGHDHHHHERGAHRGGGGRGGRDRGFFGFGAGPGSRHGNDAGTAGFGRGRKLGSDDLQLLLLALLAAQPSHGYELIKQLEERSNGYYAPSPGMVYPALTFLEEIGHASVTTEGARKRYDLTDAGREQLRQNQPRVDALFEQLSWIGKRMDDWREAMDHSGGDDGFIAELHEARRALKDALRAQGRSGPEEQKRVAAIVLRAAKEITGK
ncbi:PadR family transcriptional regulator [soil metagenome]